MIEVTVRVNNDDGRGDNVVTVIRDGGKDSPWTEVVDVFTGTLSGLGYTTTRQAISHYLEEYPYERS